MLEEAMDVLEELLGIAEPGRLNENCREAIEMQVFWKWLWSNLIIHFLMIDSNCSNGVAPRRKSQDNPK